MKQESTTEKAGHTPGPWECQIGHSDWGMPTAHIILREGDTGNDSDAWIAEIPSVTPYCMGASRKDKDRAAAQAANARLIAAAPDHALICWAMCIAAGRWEPFGDGLKGEFCINGLRYSTEMDEFGCPAVTDALRAALSKAKGASS
jgi:hypothetical protein